MNALSNLFMITDRNVSLSVDEAIRVSGLRVGYGGAPVIDDVSFRVNRGERLAVIGANGAGKSTLLKGMLGLIRPETGSATFSTGRSGPFGSTSPSSRRPTRPTGTFPAGSGILSPWGGGSTSA